MPVKEFETDINYTTDGFIVPMRIIKRMKSKRKMGLVEVTGQISDGSHQIIIKCFSFKILHKFSALTKLPIKPPCTSMVT